jgi:hypothetical protein
LSNCTALTSLNLSFCTKLSDVSAVSSCTALTDLRLGNCRELSDVSAVSNCSALRTLELGWRWVYKHQCHSSSPCAHAAAHMTTPTTCQPHRRIELKPSQWCDHAHTRYASVELTTSIPIDHAA